MASRLTRRTAFAVAAVFALPVLSRAQTDGIDVGAAQIPSDEGPLAGVYAKPAGAGPFPTVLVAENGSGLDRIVTDACHGLAKQGFFAVAPTLFAGDPPDGTLMRRLDAASSWTEQHGGDRERRGIVGFGPGGRAAWLYDAHSPALKAAVAWYGPMQGAASPARPMTALDAASHLHAPLMGLYGKNGSTPQRVLLDAEAKAKQAGRTAEIVLYVGAGQDFAVPGSTTFDQAATLDGWERTIKWLRTNGVG